jgi:hypothetical protein
MFVLVEPHDFVVGTKYKMGEHKGIFINEGHNIYDIRHYLFDLQGRRRLVPSTLNFYKFVSDQPQWNMERRAVSMIVRRLIGDENFEW